MSSHRSHGENQKHLPSYLKWQHKKETKEISEQQMASPATKKAVKDYQKLAAKIATTKEKLDELKQDAAKLSQEAETAIARDKANVDLARLAALQLEKEAAVEAEEEKEEESDSEETETDNDDDLIEDADVTPGQLAERIGELEARMNIYIGALVTPEQRRERTLLDKRLKALYKFAKEKFGDVEPEFAQMKTKPPPKTTDVPFWKRLSDQDVKQTEKKEVAAPKPAKKKSESKKGIVDELEPKTARPKTTKEKSTQRLLMPQKHIRALLQVILKGLKYDKQLRMDKNFARDMNEQFYDWIRTVMHSLEMTLHNDEQHTKKDKTACSKTISVDAMKDAVELASVGSRDELTREMNNVRRNHAQLLIIRGRVRNAMRDFEGGDRRVTRAAVDYLREAALAHALLVLKAFVKIMVDKGRVLFKSCPSFTAASHTMYGEANGFIPGDFEDDDSDHESDEGDDESDDVWE